MPVIDDIREQNKLAKGKGFKYALQYFWDYYKIHVAVVIVAIIIIISIVKSFVTYREPVFEAIIVNAANAPSEEEFAEYLGLDAEKERVYLDYSYYMTTVNDSFSESTYASAQKIMAVIASKSADIMLCKSDIFDTYKNSGIYGDLREYFSEEFLDSLGDKVIWYAIIDEDTNEADEPLPVAINVVDAPQLTDNACFKGNEVYFMIIANTQHPEYSTAFYSFLYNLPKD